VRAPDHEKEKEYELTNDFMVIDSMMDEKTISLLNDPVELSKTIKQQFDNVANRRLQPQAELSTIFRQESEE
jgi:hypothetical protein